MSFYKSFSTWAIRFSLWIVPFIPLYIASGLFFPFITGKGFLFRTLVELALLLYIPLALFYKEYRPRKSYLLIAVGLWVATIALATIFGVNPFRSFWSNYERMEGLSLYLHLFAYFLVASHVFNKRDWIIFFNIFVFAGLGQDIYASLQKAGRIASPQGGIRVDGTIGNPTYVAAYLMFVIGICGILLQNVKHWFFKSWYWVMIGFSLLTIYFAQSRGVSIGIFVGLFISALTYLFFAKPPKGKGKTQKKTVGIIVCAMLAIVLLLPIIRNTTFVKSLPGLSRITSISLSDGAARFRIWNMGWKGFLERPLLGWGPENYTIVFAKFYNPLLYSQEPWFDRSHNIVLDWLINGGILGFLSYLGMFGAAGYILWKRYLHLRAEERADAPRELRETLIICTLFLAYFIQNIFVFDQIATYISFFAFLAYIHATAIGRWKVEGAITTKPDLKNKEAKYALSAIGIVVIAAAWYIIVWKPLQANLAMLNGLRIASSTGNVIEAQKEFNRALAFKTHGLGEISEQYAIFNDQVIQSPKLPEETKLNIWRDSFAAVQKVALKNPKDPRPQLVLGLLYDRVGQTAEAVRIYENAISLAPNKQQLYFQLASILLRTDPMKGLETLKKGFEIEPSYDQARLNYILILIAAGNQPEADRLLTERYQKLDVPEPLLASAYQNIIGRLIELKEVDQVKLYRERLVSVWVALAKANPDNIDYRKNIANVLVELGKKQEAIQVLEQAIKDIPTFKEEGEKMIAGIR